MRGPKRKKVYVKKVKYDSEAEESEEETKKPTVKEMQDMDIFKGKDLHSDNSEDDISEQDFAVPEKDPLKLAEIKKSEQEIETQKSTKLASVISKILENTSESKRPVLSLKRKFETELDDQKLLVKAKKLLQTNKKVTQDQGRVYPDYSTLEYEKTLRKTSTKGVVQLFNALRAAQKSVQELESEGIQKNVANGTFTSNLSPNCV